MGAGEERTQEGWETVMYQIIIKREALKELEVLPKSSVAAIAAAIDKLAMQPRPPGCKKLKGSADSLWRVRVRDYRVIYKVDDPILIVEVRKIGHRREIYE